MILDPSGAHELLKNLPTVPSFEGKVFLWEILILFCSRKKKIYNTDQFLFFPNRNNVWYWHKMTSSNYFVYILEWSNIFIHQMVQGEIDTLLDMELHLLQKWWRSKLIKLCLHRGILPEIMPAFIQGRNLWTSVTKAGSLQVLRSKFTLTLVEREVNVLGKNA